MDLKHIPTSIWVWQVSSEGRRLTKIDTAPQEEMSTSIDNARVDMIAKIMDVENEMHERMGAGLTWLEESRFKRPIGEEEEEEIEDWHEKIKNKYEKEKFKKLTADTLALKEKMEKMHLAFCKA